MPNKLVEETSPKKENFFKKLLEELKKKVTPNKSAYDGGLDETKEGEKTIFLERLKVRLKVAREMTFLEIVKDIAYNLTSDAKKSGKNPVSVEFGRAASRLHKKKLDKGVLKSMLFIDRIKENLYRLAPAIFVPGRGVNPHTQAYEKAFKEYEPVHKALVKQNISEYSTKNSISSDNSSKTEVETKKIRFPVYHYMRNQKPVQTATGHLIHRVNKKIRGGGGRSQ